MRRSPAVDLPRAGEAGLGPDHLHAQPGEALFGIIGGDGLDHALDMGLDLGEIDHRRGLGEAKGGRPAIGRGGMGGGEQGLRGHAARIEAIPAHPLGLDQHRGRAELAGACRRHQPGGAGADDADVGGQERTHLDPPVVCPALGFCRRQWRCRTGSKASRASPPSAVRMSGLSTWPSGDLAIARQQIAQPRADGGEDEGARE